MSGKRGRKPKNLKVEKRKKVEGSGVIAGPVIRNGWGGSTVSDGRTPAKIGGNR